jgi:hypothetical protein
MAVVEQRPPAPPAVMFDVAYADPPPSVRRDRDALTGGVVGP